MTICLPGIDIILRQHYNIIDSIDTNSNFSNVVTSVSGGGDYVLRCCYLNTHVNSDTNNDVLILLSSLLPIMIGFLMIL